MTTDERHQTSGEGAVTVRGELGPLRRVVREWNNEHGVQVETLECGHVIHRKQDAFGHTNARRRRCRHCRDTARLRTLVEQPEQVTFWGAEYTITPRLIGRSFGDGKRMICIQPLATRPNYFVVRVSSEAGWDVRDELDDIMDAAEDEYGTFGDEEYQETNGDESRGFPVCDWGVGCTWGERFMEADLPGRRRADATLERRV